MGTGVLIDKDTDITKISCFVMDYGERSLGKKEICRFSEGIPDKPVGFKLENLYGLKSFDSAFSFDDYLNEASYSAFGVSGRVFVSFGRGMDCIKVFNMFPVGMITKDNSDMKPGYLVDNGEIYGSIFAQDESVAKAKDKYAQDLFFSSKELLMDIRKISVSYSELLQQEYSARRKFIKESKRLQSKFIKTSSMKKAVAKLKKEVDGKTYERRNIGLELNSKMKQIHEAYFACDMLSKTSLGPYSEMMEKMAKDFKNLIILDVVRKRSLGKDVPGGPKMMIAVESASKMNKHCRRLNSFLSYSAKSFIGFNEQCILRLNEGSSSINIDKEKQRRFVRIMEAVNIRGINSDCDPSIFYKGQYVYFLKKLNKGDIIKFDDSMIVDRMMKAGYSDDKIERALINFSIENVGRPRSEVISLISNCRIRYNNEMNKLQKNAKKNMHKNNVLEKEKDQYRN